MDRKAREHHAMIVDASALVAIAVGEPAAGALVTVLATAPAPAIGAPTAVEAAIVLENRFPGKGEAILRRLLAQFGIQVLPFPDSLWPLAHSAYARFGRGRHPANLNFGDCLCYAVARAADEPLLCVGDDFPHTDLRLVQG